MRGPVADDRRGTAGRTLPDREVEGADHHPGGRARQRRRRQDRPRPTPAAGGPGRRARSLAIVASVTVPPRPSSGPRAGPGPVGSRPRPPCGRRASNLLGGGHGLGEAAPVPRRWRPGPAGSGRRDPVTAVPIAAPPPLRVGQPDHRVGAGLHLVGHAHELVEVVVESAMASAGAADAIGSGVLLGNPMSGSVPAWASVRESGWVRESDSATGSRRGRRRLRRGECRR